MFSVAAPVRAVVDEVAAAAEANGGTVLSAPAEHTKPMTLYNTVIADPDGHRFEFTVFGDAPTLLRTEVVVSASLAECWKCWTTPEHITQWNQASEDWHCPSAVNEAKAGGRFSWRMEARDGSKGFDFCGHYFSVDAEKRLRGTLDDGRWVETTFDALDDGSVRVVGVFAAESSFPPDAQRSGWQAILDCYKKHVEAHAVVDDDDRKIKKSRS